MKRCDKGGYLCVKGCGLVGRTCLFLDLYLFMHVCSSDEACYHLVWPGQIGSFLANWNIQVWREDNPGLLKYVLKNLLVAGVSAGLEDLAVAAGTSSWGNVKVVDMHKGIHGLHEWASRSHLGTPTRWRWDVHRLMAHHVRDMFVPIDDRHVIERFMLSALLPGNHSGWWIV